MGRLFDQDEDPGPVRGGDRAVYDQDDPDSWGRPLPSWPEPAAADPTGQPMVLRIRSSTVDLAALRPPAPPAPPAPLRPQRPRPDQPRPAPPRASPSRPEAPSQPGPRPRPTPARAAPAPRPTPAPLRRRPPPALPRPSRPTSLATSSAVMAGGTLLSRVTGFARVVLVATILGTTGLGDAYNLANSVPNIVYDLLLGGILSATLVPVFVAELGGDDPDGAAHAVSAVVTAIVAGLLAVSTALYLLAPLVLRFYLLLDHATTKGAEQAVGTSLLRLFAPQVLLLGAIVVSTALLNARRHFGVAAVSPVVNNLVAISALLATRAVAPDLAVGPFRHEHGPLLVLGIGTTAGYLAQLVVQLPAMRRAGIRLRPVWDPGHPAVRRVAGLSAWLIGTVVANQVSYNVILLFAARRSGDVTVYTTAYQFFQLPYALFTVSVASTLTPDLAERWHLGDQLGFQRRLIRALRVTLGIMVPAAAGYVVIASPLIDLGVLYGHVSLGGATSIGSSLAWFAAGLPGFSAFALLMRAFQSMQDTRAMFAMYVVENALSLVLTVALYPAMGVEGLAVAFVAPYTVVAVVAAGRLGRSAGSLGGSLTVRALARIVLATAATVTVLLAVEAVAPAGRGHVALLARLLLEVVTGAATFVAAAKVLGIDEIQPVLGLARPLIRRSR